MEATSRSFKSNVKTALKDEQLQRAMKNVGVGFVDKRRKAMDKLPEFDQLRDEARDIKNHTFQYLDLYYEAYEKKVRESGGYVHFAPTDADARDIILEICRKVGAKTVTKGKSMIAEEIAINPHLEANGIRPIETDLGEYII
ncbi:MAG: LUD domain-containing protein, partial [Fimbriimonadaceae bacterium]|nr:LUD domain-containing protein [Alphaproteobacteria bacterium]